MTTIWMPIGKPLTTIVLRIGEIGKQIAKLAAAEPERQVARIDVDDEAEEGGVIGDEGRDRRAGDAELRRRAEPEDEDRVEAAVEHHREDHEPQGRQAVARAAQRHHQQGQQQDRRHGEEDHAADKRGRAGPLRPGCRAGWRIAPDRK